MTKTELIAAIAAKGNVKKSEAEEALNLVVETIKDAMVQGEKVSLVGFGTFEVRDQKERVCMNPSTKEKITVPACKAPAFKAGKGLKDAVNNR